MRRKADITTIPDVLARAFADAPEAKQLFVDLPASHQREYITWIADARRDDMRERRAAQTVMRLLERSGS